VKKTREVNTFILLRHSQALGTSPLDPQSFPVLIPVMIPVRAPDIAHAMPTSRTRVREASEEVAGDSPAPKRPCSKKEKVGTYGGAFPYFAPCFRLACDLPLAGKTE
jgi:hypothetical protein